MTDTKRTHYSHRLKAEIAAYARRGAALDEGLARIVSYLMSPKFHEDTTVQVGDILLRIEEIRSEATEAFETDPTESDDDDQNGLGHERLSSFSTS